MGEHKSKPNQEQILLSFIAKMMTDKGLQLSREQDQKLRARLFDKLNEQIEQSLVRALPNDKLVLLDEMLDDDLPSEVIEKLFDESGVDMQAVVARTMEDFRQAFLKEGQNNAAEVKAANGGSTQKVIPINEEGGKA